MNTNTPYSSLVEVVLGVRVYREKQCLEALSSRQHTGKLSDGEVSFVNRLARTRNSR